MTTMEGHSEGGASSWMSFSWPWTSPVDMERHSHAATATDTAADAPNQQPQRWHGKEQILPAAPARPPSMARPPPQPPKVGAVTSAAPPASTRMAGATTASPPSVRRAPITSAPRKPITTLKLAEVERLAAQRRVGSRSTPKATPAATPKETPKSVASSAGPGGMTRVELGQMLSKMEKGQQASEVRSEKERRKQFMLEQKERIRQRGVQLRQTQRANGRQALEAVAAKAALRTAPGPKIVSLATCSSLERMEVAKILERRPPDMYAC